MAPGAGRSPPHARSTRHCRERWGSRLRDHHVPRAEFRDQHLIHIGLERWRVGRPGENQRRRTPSGPGPRLRSSNPTRGARALGRSPRRAQAWVGVIAVLTPVSSTKTSRVPPSAAPSPGIPPLGLHFGVCRSPARQVASSCRSGGSGGGRQGAGEAAPLLGCSRVASGCSANRTASCTRRGSRGLATARRVGVWGSGCRRPDALDQSGDERDTDRGTVGDSRWEPSPASIAAATRSRRSIE